MGNILRPIDNEEYKKRDMIKFIKEYYIIQMTEPSSETIVNIPIDNETAKYIDNDLDAKLSLGVKK
ncbi:MAG: hypothetical protein Pg6B_09280 [Candidatus Azobacteroides pseudotrichonymphae]|jgi:hypothetical protein|nr:MAG: hypothetical protein Pg6B_09280 [Candidatus Azobacteroides pseudotrichonymphae]